MLQTAGVVEVEEEEREGVRMEKKKRRMRREKAKRALVMEGEEAGAEEEDSSEDIAQDMSGGEDQEDLEMRKVLLQHLGKRKEETWRVMREAGEEGEVVAVEDSEDAEDSVDVEVSAELDSVEDLEEEVDSEETGEEETGEVSVAAAGLEETEEDPEETGETEEDSAEVGEDSVEATTEERAVLNSNNFSPSPPSFQIYQKVSSLLQPHRLKFFFFIFDNSSLDFLLYSNDQSYKNHSCVKIFIIYEGHIQGCHHPIS